VRRAYSNYGDRCFAAAGPKLWNSLPTEHCDKLTLAFNDLSGY